MQTFGKTTAPVIFVVLAIITSWVWLPRLVAAVIGDWTRPWFSIVWFGASIVAITVAIALNWKAFSEWIRAPFRR